MFVNGQHGNRWLVRQGKRLCVRTRLSWSASGGNAEAANAVDVNRLLDVLDLLRSKIIEARGSARRTYCELPAEM